MSVEVDGLTVLYGSQRAVNGISFTARPGEIVGFLGPNGAGKSTTMKVVTGYLPPTEGTARVCGYDVQSASIDARRCIGYLPEHNPLYLDMYVHEFLNFAGSFYIGHSGTRIRRVGEMIELCGLAPEQNKRIGALSKGYRQRTGLAQALLHDPEVLILDEPTTGLDPNQIAEIRQLILTLSRNKTVILSTHIMQEVQALCNRVMIINKGSIVADESSSSIRSMLGGEVTVLVEFREDVDSGLFRNIDGVLRVTEPEPHHFRISAAAGTDIRPELFRLAANQGYTLLRLSQEENSMEEIFRQLTQTNQVS